MRLNSFNDYLLESKLAESCPRATQDLELNTKNRNRAIEAEHIEYGPLNLSDEAYWDRAKIIDMPSRFEKDHSKVPESRDEQFEKRIFCAEHWKTTVDVAKKSTCGNCAAFDISPRMNQCMPGELEDEEGKLGYCWMHNFKCHSARTCYTWAAGGPITSDSVSKSWQNKD